MAHGTKISGVAYGISGGKCLVGGTEYAIKKGRTLIGGTGYDISFGPELLDTFSDNSWEEIIWACQNNSVPSTWNVADSKSMTINNTSYQIDIIGKEHDTYTSGGTAPLTFQMHDCYTEKKRMNSSNTNVGGYDSTEMHNTTLPSILSMMPASVQSGIKSVNKLSSVGDQSATIETVPCKLFLLSEIEIFGTVSNSYSGEGEQYEYYASGNSKIKNLGGTRTPWSGRSPSNKNESYFFIVNNGVSASTGAASAFGVAFAFCF